MRNYISFILICVFASSVSAQDLPVGPRLGGLTGEGDGKKEVTIKPDIRSWKLIDDLTFADTIAVDTLTTSVQIFNPIYRKSIGNVHTGNLGAPSISSILDNRQQRPDFIFYNPLISYFDYPKDVVYYNTRTPYVNLTYHSGQPKRRAEEFVKALFTQNITKHWNVGMQYALYSSQGRYDSQKAKNSEFRLFSSYNGAKYNASGGLIYAKAIQQENGGISNEEDILNPEASGYDYDQPENVPVNFRDAENYLRSFQVYYNQSYNLGQLARKDKEGEEQLLPVSTIFHSLHVDLAKRQYTIGELPDYADAKTEKFYPNVYIDSTKTDDQTEYTLVKNQFQIKFNEEANSLLRFGLRAFVGNDIRLYNTPAAPFRDEDNKVFYRYNDTTLVTSYVGGQLFKNIGQTFRWNAGMRFYFQGYRVGDLEVTGKVQTNLSLLGQPTEFFADGGFFLRSPELLEEHYFSNHIKWDQSLIREKTLKVRGGIRLPELKMHLTGSVRSINGYIYYNKNGEADQNEDLIQVLSVEAAKHFKWLRLNSVNQAVWQYTSNSNALPLPDLTLYSSNFYENILFKVLTFQIGFDLHYHTKYYTPYYYPAIGQFISQDYRKVGNYPFADVFLNLQLKRARIYVKYDHINKGWPDNNYFYTVGYPANPRSLKFGVSWNFYD
ncbi:MAG: putative porin [Breznakibacter sp.]|nr:putative porin [Breznakibacter sp.]